MFGYAYPTHDKVYIKILKFFNDHPNSAYRHCVKHIWNKDFLKDVDTFKGLLASGLVEFTGKGRRGLMLYSITSRGKMLLDEANAYPYYIDIIKIADESETYPEFMINLSLNGIGSERIDVLLATINSYKGSDDKLARHVYNHFMKHCKFSKDMIRC